MKSRLRLILLSMSFLLSGGCVTPSQPVISYLPRVPWPEAEYAHLSVKGANTVSGQAFMKTRGGDVKTAAGEVVALNPVTSYSTQFFNFAVLGKHEPFQALDPEAADPRIAQYLKQVTADASGKFTFYNVAPGEYFLYTLVRWEAPSGNGLQQQGGWVGQRVTVRNDERNEFILNR